MATVARPQRGDDGLTIISALLAVVIGLVVVVGPVIDGVVSRARASAHRNEAAMTELVVAAVTDRLHGGPLERCMTPEDVEPVVDDVAATFGWGPERLQVTSVDDVSHAPSSWSRCPDSADVPGRDRRRVTAEVIDQGGATVRTIVVVRVDP